MRVSFLLAYPNPHVLDWALEITNIELNIGCIDSTQKYRPGYFKEYDELNNVHYFFKNKSSELMFQKKLRESDVLVTLGIFETRLFKLRKYCNSNIRLIVLSEPFNPINSRKRYILRRLWCFIIRTKYRTIDFYCIGGIEVKDYYILLGFHNSLYYNFGYFSNLSFSPPRKRTLDNPITIGFIGQLIHRKGFDRLLRLIEFLNSSTHNYKLDIAGDGELKEKLIEKLEELNNPKINFIGLLNDKGKVEGFLENVDILFVPSYFDGWGAVVNEGIAKSCAIIASSKVYAAKTMIHNNVGFVFNTDFLKPFETYFNDRILLVQHQENCASLYLKWNPKTIANEVAANVRDNSEGQILFEL